MIKKIGALLCVIAMTCSLLACGNVSEEKSSEQPKQSSATKESSSSASSEEKKEEPKEPVEIVYWYGNSAGIQEYTDEVEDLLNEMLAKTDGYEHITIKLSPHKDFATDFSLAQVSGDQIDLVTLSGLDYAKEIANGSFIPLDELLAANEEITADLPDWFVKLGMYDGKQYFVPSYQQCSNEYFMYIPKEYQEASGYTVDEMQEIMYSKDFDAMAKMMEDLVLNTRKKTGIDTKYLPGYTLSEPKYWFNDSNKIYAVQNTFNMFYWDEEKECVEFACNNENIKKAYLKQGEWYAKGLIHPGEGIESNLFGGMALELSQVYSMTQGYGTPKMATDIRNSNEASLKENGEIVSVKLLKDNFIGDVNAAGGVAISSTCKHPEEAAKVIALLFNSKYSDFYNTLIYGLEGIHYEKVSDEEVKTLEYSGSQGGANTTYAYHKWRGGNTFNAWRNQSITKEQNDYILNEINESETTKKSPLIGITWNTKVIENELSQIKAITGEYYVALANGHKGMDTQAYYDEFMQKLEVAGLSKVLNEFNAQAKAFLESK